MISVFTQLKDTIEEAQKKAREQIPDVLKSIVPAHEKVIGLAWKQYAPYFNDGDPCEFDVHEPYLVLNLEDNDEDDDEWNNRYNGKEMKEAGYITDEEIEKIDDFYQFASSNPKVLGALFGDDCIVTVNKDGTTTIEDYSGNHD